MNDEMICNDYLELHISILKIELEELTVNEQKEWLKIMREIVKHIPERIKDLDQIYQKLFMEVMEDKGEEFYEKMEQLNRISEKISVLNAFYFQIQGYFVHRN